MPNGKLLSFDIEISDLFDCEKGEDIEQYAPFHISVAATAIHDGEELVWYSKDASGGPSLNLTKQRAHELLEYLDDKQRNNFMVCAWGGLGFDLKWIGHVAGDMEFAAQIALKSYDPMFQFFNQNGFLISLAKVAEAMGIDQKKLMNGADAPKQWHAGNHQAVMNYCLGDCQMTNQIIRAIQASGQISWVTTKGYVKSKPMPHLKIVEAVISDPAPDQSWMDNPPSREKYFEWVVEAKGLQIDE